MLTDIHVKNLALIDEAEVSLSGGLNILTGETGAGKSILIDSIGIALGQKLARDMLREGGEPGLIELIFSVESAEMQEKLAALDVEPEEGQLIISRKLKEGRSVIRVNGEACTAARARDIATVLLEIHGQHEHQKLLYPAHQLEILDAFDREHIEPQKKEVAQAYRDFRAVSAALKDYDIDEHQRERELSFLDFEIQEIEEAALQEGEDEALEKEYRRMANAQKIAEHLGAVHRLLAEDGGAEDSIGLAAHTAAELAGYDESLKNISDTLSDLDGMVGDLSRDIAAYLDDFTFSEEAFALAERRLDLINNLKAKYGGTIPAIRTYLETQRQRKADLENFEQKKQALLKKSAEAEQRLRAASSALSMARQDVAESFAMQLREELIDLNFLSVDFAVQFVRTGNYRADGWDELQFLISTNPGEAARPLARVVSGGELSRIMLAIRTLLADRDATETLIFDEIDTGISGRTAQMVSEKMARIAANHQVICITHLAQIAAMADHHFVITKQLEDGRTISHIRELKEEASVEELARILGGAEITPKVMESAAEMRRLAEERKRLLRGEAGV